MQLPRGSYILFSLLASAVSAQQGVLTNGNSQLPACAQGCQLLVQAAQACSGTNAASQQTWICFCQSAYLTNLKTSAVGVCDAACTNPTDNQQVSTWYNSNCGSDNGASEHANDAGGAATSAAAGATNAASSSAAAATASNTAGSSSSNISSSSSNVPHGTWWDNHYKWIIMLIVLAIALPILGFGAAWLKRRHDRKQDKIGSGFNAGITERQAPMSSTTVNNSGIVAGGTGTSSPARTREAFMPYGYGYARSESRLGSKQAMHDDRRSPSARGGTPMGDMEKNAGIMEAPEPTKKKSRKVLVREKEGQ